MTTKLKLEYDNKYHLWNDLAQANTDRLFVPSQELPRLGQRVPVEIAVQDISLCLVIRGRVIGLRQGSRRFQQGVYLHISERELQKCRRFLGLRPMDRDLSRVRRSLRVYHELPVRFINPPLKVLYQTRNISETGMLLAGPSEMTVGQLVKVELLAGEAPLVLEAEVAWVSLDKALTGLHLLDLSEETVDGLRMVIQEALRFHHAQAKGPAPILVADDDPDIVMFITKALSVHGYDVYQALNGDEALSMIRELHPALVLMDILMPRIDGSEICRAMRSDVELCSIPVIYISALDPQSLHQVADESGATDYLAKPVPLTELIDTVGYYLRDR